MLSKSRTRRRLQPFHNNMIRIVLLVGLSDIGIVDLAVAQLILQDFHRVLRDDVHRIVDLNLQDKVRAAA